MNAKELAAAMRDQIDEAVAAGKTTKAKTKFADGARVNGYEEFDHNDSSRYTWNAKGSK